MSQERNELPCSPDTTFTLAISGGGHRATLYGLGGLMAIVDAEANSRTKQIASVSGGSITNLFVAQTRDFHKTTAGEFDHKARDLFETVTRGVLTKPVLVVLIVIIFGPIIAFTVAALAVQAGVLLPPATVTEPRVALSVFIILLWLLVALLRGLPIESLMAKCYLSARSRRISLGLINTDSAGRGKGTDHVICCTDLVSGKPVYFSTSRGGKAYTRFGDDNPVIVDASNVFLSAILRASAGFPGIPPRRFQIAQGSWLSSLWPLRPHGTFRFLSDGGIWNNLGTQAYIDDHFYDGEWGGPSSDSPKLVLSLDASADLDQTSGWDLHLPGWAEIKALLRQAAIQNTNTVEPRREKLKNDFSTAVTSGILFGRAQQGVEVSRWAWKPFATVISLSQPPAEVTRMIARWLFSRWLKLGSDVTEFGQLDPQLWKQVDLGTGNDLVQAGFIRDALRGLSSRSHVWNRAVSLLESPIYRELCEITGEEAPKKFSLGRANFFADQHGDLESRWKSIVVKGVQTTVDTFLHSQKKVSKNDAMKVPTTLGSVDRSAARRVVGRGYANTAITLYMLGLINVLPSPGQHHPWIFKE